MGLFGFKKEKEKTEEATCSCGGGCSSATVKVLGSGCAKCNQLEAAAREALEELGVAVPITHVTDFTEIAAYGVMSTPALVVNEQVISAGRVLKKAEVVDLLKKEGSLLK